ncbi:helix-turn-helix domain-containing protein [Candidatus Woesearchaeota archaeon]|nr:helix-turn-helix domain-containing protein [Candidatus Woesearchaeota archaeon]
MKQSLLEKISIYLLKAGYTLKSLTRTCFDIVARKESQILLIKVLEDANSISGEYAREMQRISSYIGGSPAVIAEKAAVKLEDNVVYSRFGIHTLNYNTFCSCIGNRMPFIMRDRAGLKAKIAPDILKEKIEEKGFSLSALAKKLGVSRKMIQRYEEGKADITINKARRMYDALGPSVFEKINIFSVADISQAAEGKTDVTKKYSDLGFEAAETKKAPFDVIAKKEKEIILTEIGDKTSPQLKPLSKLIDADKLVIFKSKKPKEKDIPALTKKEFMEFEKAKELVKFLKEFE